MNQWINRDINKPIVLSHTYLLLGCCLPTWFTTFYTCSYFGFMSGQGVKICIASSGILTVAVGDAVVWYTLLNKIYLTWHHDIESTMIPWNRMFIYIIISFKYLFICYYNIDILILLIFIYFYTSIMFLTFKYQTYTQQNYKLFRYFLILTTTGGYIRI
jgi:hypothetical protein